MRWTIRIRTQLKSAPGCAGYTMDAKPFTKTFWTLSAWSPAEAMEVFASRTAPPSFRRAAPVIPG